MEPRTSSRLAVARRRVQPRANAWLCEGANGRDPVASTETRGFSGVNSRFIWIRPRMTLVSPRAVTPGPEITVISDGLATPARQLDLARPRTPGGTARIRKKEW